MLNENMGHSAITTCPICEYNGENETINMFSRLTMTEDQKELTNTEQIGYILGSNIFKYGGYGILTIMNGLKYRYDNPLIALKDVFPGSMEWDLFDDLVTMAGALSSMPAISSGSVFLAGISFGKTLNDCIYSKKVQFRKINRLDTKHGLVGFIGSIPGYVSTIPQIYSHGLSENTYRMAITKDDGTKGVITVRVNNDLTFDKSNVTFEEYSGQGYMMSQEEAQKYLPDNDLTHYFLNFPKRYR